MPSRLDVGETDRRLAPRLEALLSPIDRRRLKNNRRCAAESERKAEPPYHDQGVLGLVDVCELATHGEWVGVEGAKLFLS